MNIELLVKNFYEGFTTPEEERLLSEYFLNEENMDERWKAERQLFRLMHDTQIQVPSGISEQLEKSIMQMDASQKYITHKRSWYYWISGAAAVALLCIGLFFAIHKPSPPKMTDTFKDPKEAALVAEHTLAYMSIQLNKGLNKVSDAEMKIDKINQILNKHLNK